jgi:hypothetical protein
MCGQPHVDYVTGLFSAYLGVPHSQGYKVLTAVVIWPATVLRCLPLFAAIFILIFEDADILLLLMLLQSASATCCAGLG